MSLEAPLQVTVAVGWRMGATCLALLSAGPKLLVMSEKNKIDVIIYILVYYQMMLYTRFQIHGAQAEDEL